MYNKILLCIFFLEILISLTKSVLYILNLLIDILKWYRNLIMTMLSNIKEYIKKHEIT